MDIDPLIALAGLLVGFVVGLTGMGGGALMTPLLVLLFDIEPLAAVSSDLVAAFVMKPVGATVHFRRGTVHLELVRWLVVGSVPAAFTGVLILNQLGDGDGVQDRIKVVLGGALLVAATSILLKQRVARRNQSTAQPGPPAVRRLPTVVVGVLGGLIVGMTSVGSGSLIIVMLLALYPRLTASELVGTDLLQAIPLVGSAALGHLLYGDFQLGLTASLLLGALPGVYAGARASAKAPDRLIRPVLIVVLAASGLKLVGAGNLVVGAFVLVAAVVAAVAALRNRPVHLPAVVVPRSEGRSGPDRR